MIISDLKSRGSFSECYGVFDKDMGNDEDYFLCEAGREKEIKKMQMWVCIMIYREHRERLTRLHSTICSRQKAQVRKSLLFSLLPLMSSIFPSALFPLSQLYTNRYSSPDPAAPPKSPCPRSALTIYPWKISFLPLLCLLLCVSLCVWLLIFLHCSACLSPRACHLYSNRCAVYVTDVFVTCSTACSHSLHGE